MRRSSGRLAPPLAARAKAPVTTTRFLSLLSAAAAALLLLAPAPVRSQPAPLPARVAPAIDGLLEAFRSYPVVAIADEHGLAQELDFYAALVRDPRFASEVGAVVVEFGSAAHQPTLDRYLSGETVPYAELRKVWSDTVEGAWTYLGYMNFLAQVRATNASLAPARRIRVLLGDPAIDWSKVTTKAALTPFELQRDSHPAELIRREILAKGKKALVIYGGGHLYRSRNIYIPGAAADPRAEAALRRFFRDLAAGSLDDATLTPAWADRIRGIEAGLRVEAATYGELRSAVFEGRFSAGDKFLLEFAKARVRAGIHLNAQGLIDGVGFERVAGDGGQTITERVEETYPGSVFFVSPYTGLRSQGCAANFERAHPDWRAPSLIWPVRGTSVGAELMAEGCMAGSGSTADALLYLGPAAALTLSAEHPDIYLDDAYRQEQSRRQAVWSEPLPRFADMQDYPSTAKPLP